MLLALMQAAVPLKLVGEGAERFATQDMQRPAARAACHCKLKVWVFHSFAFERAARHTCG